MDQESCTRYQAKWILPVEGEPIENGIIEIANGIIRSLHKSHGTELTNDLGEVALIPGLVNAHTHLEFSGLREPLGQAGIELTDWIRLVVQNRQEGTGSSKAQAIHAGIKESLEAGVVAIGEIATSPVSLADYGNRIAATVFVEQLGRNANEVDSKIASALQFLDQDRQADLHTGVSPHAPYSVHPRLFGQLVDLAVKYNKPIAMHLAETRAELELLSNQTGSFVSLLRDLGAWVPDSFHAGMTVMDYLKRLAQADRVLIVHGNYLQDQEIEFIAQHKSRMSVVFCPRTHEFFGHSPYPLQQLIDAGINIAVGTDSRASNPDLDLFSELKTIARRHPNVSPTKLLEMGTINGPRSLNGHDRFGSLRANHAGRINIVSSDAIGSKGINGLFCEDSKCIPLQT